MAMHTLTLDKNEKTSLDYVVSFSEEAFLWLSQNCTEQKDAYIVKCTDDDLHDLLDLMDDIKHEADIADQTDEDAFYALEDLLLLALEEKE